MGPPPAVAAVRCVVRDALADLHREALVLVACSGGADSLALAAATAHEAPRLGLRAGAVTVDHGLQAGSAERAGAVARTLGELALDPVCTRTVTVGADGGPEAAARSARYAALDAAADELGAAAVLLGHTRDDQAETVLLRLSRGSGARSLAAMPSSTGRYLRPLLELPRDEVRKACELSGLTPWQDPHNTDPAYSRSRVRGKALPALERALGPGVAAALARTASLLREDADALDGWAEQAYAGCATGHLAFDVQALALLPAAVRSRVLRRAALAAGAPAGALGRTHVAALDRLITAWHGQRHVDVPGAIRAVRERGVLRFVGTEGETGPHRP
ncbi:MAG: tRNA lysidine(34) synthetase TilS [Streptosporangiales bacterium]